MRSQRAQTPRPHDRPRSGGRTLLGELLLVSAFVLLYGGVRALTEGGEDRALANARLLIRLENALHLDWERPLQDAALAHRPLVTLANWVYVWGFWPVLAAVAVLLFWKRRDSYRLLRDALFISGAIGFAFFALLPVAPPRLADPTIVDTISAYSRSYRAFHEDSGLVNQLVNQYAAFPSLHVGWAVLMGIGLIRLTRGIGGWALGGLVPTATAAAVVLTGNHFLVDVGAGAAAAVAGLAVAKRLRPLPLAAAGRLAGEPSSQAQSRYAGGGT